MKNQLDSCCMALLCVFCAITAAHTQNYSSETRPVVAAAILQSDPVIDGDILNDQVWQSVPAFGNLIQSKPNSGAPASEKTEIRIAYSAHSFYVAVVCYDSRPDQLVVSDSRRDASLDNTDAFLFILDTYKDGQNGFVFGTSPAGVEYDAQVDNEGQGNRSASRQQTGTIGGYNLNWDASWEVKTKVGDFGWSSEFAIPLNTLRFTTGQNQEWGVNFQRNIRKNNEVVYWAPMPIEFDIKRLSLAGTLRNLNLQSPGNLKVIPYALVSVNSNHLIDPTDTEVKPEVGLDVKYSITPAMTLDLTYNTDFAQVEVDEQQVNLDRFNLFFPEKRPFFLENAGLFAVGSPGEVELFFSRKIGIGANSSLVPILGGARLSGKVKRTNVGLLSMITDEVEEAGIEKNNFTVARVNHELAQRSSIGGAIISKFGLGESDEKYNHTMAVDGKWGIGKKAQISGFFAKSADPGSAENEFSYKFQSAYEWDGLLLNLAYTEVGEGFNPEVGFLQRSGFRKPEALALQRIRMNGKFGLLEIRPHISWRAYWDYDDFLVTSFLHVDNHWEFESGMEIHTGINFTTEGVSKPFQIAKDVTVPAGTYNHREAQLVFWTNQSKPVFISTRHILGGFFGGKRYNNGITLGIRIGDKFNSQFSLERNDINLPGGEFTTNIFRSRISYSITPKIFLQGLIQYNSVADILSTNVRLGWIQKANTGLFLVFNESRSDGELANRTIIIKYSRMFDIIK
jgi:hypothetical protein